MNNVHFMSKTDIHITPDYLFKKLNDEFNFTLDPCALPENAKCQRFFTPFDDGLSHPWICETVFMNPPYGKIISKWIFKAWFSAFLGSTTVCLIPARTDTNWWHDYVVDAELRFIRGRIKFGNSIHNAPFPSVIAIFHSRIQK